MAGAWREEQSTIAGLKVQLLHGGQGSPLLVGAAGLKPTVGEITDIFLLTPEEGCSPASILILRKHLILSTLRSLGARFQTRCPPQIAEFGIGTFGDRPVGVIGLAMHAQLLWHQVTLGVAVRPAVSSLPQEPLK